MLKGLETLPIVGSGAGRGQWQCSIDTSKGQSGSPVLRANHIDSLRGEFMCFERLNHTTCFSFYKHEVYKHG